MMTHGCLQVQHSHSEYASVVIFNNMPPHGKCIIGSKLDLVGIGHVGCKVELLSRHVLVMVPEEQEKTMRSAM